MSCWIGEYAQLHVVWLMINQALQDAAIRWSYPVASAAIRYRVSDVSYMLFDTSSIH